MNVLVVGQGGREHALVRALVRSPSVRQVHVMPGSHGMEREARLHRLSWENLDAVCELIRSERIDLVVIGPEAPLAGGLADALRRHGIRVVGPSQGAARLESSKIYSKEFMVEAGVRTARFRTVRSVNETEAAARDFAPPYVLKADGLAAGKGVFICQTLHDLAGAARALFEERRLGEAGDRALLEEFQPGYELSYLILTNGESHEPLVLAQDHKRLQDGDHGPNTGGMGVVAPVAIDTDLRARIDAEVIRPVVAHLKRRGLLYRGVLYVGLMVTKDGPSVLEFNTRFGDPEAQVILPLMADDWGVVFQELADGRVRPLRWKQEAAACVVMAAEGYPDRPQKGVAIQGLDEAPNWSEQYFLHAGTDWDSEKGWVTAGGRVLNAVGIGKTLREAIDRAYRQSGNVMWPGVQMRHDIGAKLLK